jgi:hypothetical protein
MHMTLAAIAAPRRKLRETVFMVKDMRQTMA